ncbi:MAG: DUF1508 domain-containing protein [Ignavibacteriales bacterium]|nr:DUF1508 domain-containing protein [Ignavibacteriota bacterium]MCB9250811.1 DUF1508 domain-containing protein [Ignavibacteriales bacterium]
MKFHVYKDSRAEWRWRLKATNGKIIATSGEGYNNKQDCLHAIDLIKTYSPIAEVVED